MNGVIGIGRRPVADSVAEVDEHGCLLDVIITGRMPRSSKLPVLNLLRPKIRFFFVPQGRLVAPIQVKLGRADGHLGSLGCAKFHLNRRRGWECGPKISKMSTFLVKSRLTGANPLTNF